MAGVGDIDGEGEESRTGGDVECNGSWSAILLRLRRSPVERCVSEREFRDTNTDYGLKSRVYRDPQNKELKCLRKLS